MTYKIIIIIIVSSFSLEGVEKAMGLRTSKVAVSLISSMKCSSLHFLSYKIY